MSWKDMVKPEGRSIDTEISEAMNLLVMTRCRVDRKDSS